MQLNGDVHTDRKVSVTSQFRSVAVASENVVTEPVRTGLYLVDSGNVNSLTSPPANFECLLATGAACFCLQKWTEN